MWASWHAHLFSPRGGGALSCLSASSSLAPCLSFEASPNQECPPSLFSNSWGPLLWYSARLPLQSGPVDEILPGRRHPGGWWALGLSGLLCEPGCGAPFSGLWGVTEHSAGNVHAVLASSSLPSSPAGQPEVCQNSCLINARNPRPGWGAEGDNLGSRSVWESHLPGDCAGGRVTRPAVAGALSVGLCKHRVHFDTRPPKWADLEILSPFETWGN